MPSLDGVRGLSILLVVGGHFVSSSWQRSGGRPEALGPLTTYGAAGVTMFFALSGFLITTLLRRELDSRDTIDLVAFYKRRALRILPAFLAYTLLVSLLSVSIRGHAPTSRSIAHTLLFLTNYRVPVDWWLAHTWSLSCEEQFYLLWPAAVLILRRRWASAAALALVLGAPAIRWLTVTIVPRASPFLPYMLHTRIDALMIGCWMALARPGHGAVLRLLANRWAAAASGVLLLYLLPQLHLGQAFEQYVEPTIAATACGSILAYAVTAKSGWVYWLFNCWPMRQLGVLSYSLYLWQQPFADHYAEGWPFRAPLNVLLATGVAVGSYVLIERPFNVLRSRVRSGAR